MALSLNLIAQSVAIAIDTLAATGSARVSKDDRGVYTVTPAPEQVPILQEIINRASSGEPSVTVELTPVIAPLIIQKALPYIVGVVGLTFLIGRLTARR